MPQILRKTAGSTGNNQTINGIRPHNLEYINIGYVTTAFLNDKSTFCTLSDGHRGLCAAICSVVYPNNIDIPIKINGIAVNIFFIFISLNIESGNETYLIKSTSF